MGVKTYYDSGSKNGLCLIVSYGGSKNFYFLCYFQGRPVRVKIRKQGHISLADVRRATITMREHANKGEDPSAPRREIRESVTLRDFYNEHYKPRHALVFKRLNSIKSDDVAFRHALKTLHSHKMIAITRDDIARVHATLRQMRGPATANHALALISNMYNKAIELGLYPREKLNPVFGIRKFPEPSRDRFMTGAEIRRFFSALASYQALAGSNLYIIGKSLGHKSLASAQVYARLAVEPIRESMQRGTDKMLGFLNMNTTGHPLPISL